MAAMDDYQIEFSKGAVSLNDEQYRVVTSPLGENQRILASAGSGKTTTITSRIAYLVEEYKVNPKHILLVSFSRSAAQEMIHRVQRLIGSTAMYAGTFHALSAQILREKTPALLQDQPFIDELPYRLVKWLETTEGQKWVKRFRTVIVDEFQDINQIQWNILRHFCHPLATMTIVGDDAQNIYTWRGSSVEFILNFHERMPFVRDYQLCRNYRSTEAIVTIANSVMRFIPTLPFKEKMVAHARGGRKPEVHFFFRATDEYDWILHSVEKLRRQYPEFTFAVLSRYNSDLYRMEERFHKKGIPYSLLTHYHPEDSHTKKKPITLSTIHASKGLEWDIVFFMNLHDDVFPSRKSDEDIVCERRLFYVGVTRAKKGLYLTYSRQERSLSRFVREIPRPFLTFHNITSFKLSVNEAYQTMLSLEDMLRGLDGADWNELREQNHVPVIKQYTTESIYPFGKLFTIPSWVKTHDVRETWLEMMRLVTLRECARYQNKLEQLETPAIHEALLTLRIYKEDIEFWESFEAELELIVHRFLKHTHDMPAVEYGELEAYVQHTLPHLAWTAAELSHALVIIAKIRGQLRPLRYIGFDLNEFSFGCVRNAVPTEWRPDVLTSWHRIIDKTKKTHEILIDVWRLATITSVIEGRNIPLYQTVSIATHLKNEDQQEMVQAMEAAIPVWMATQENPTFHFQFEVEGIRPIPFDIMTEKCAYQLFFDPVSTPSMEDKILFLLKQYAYEEIFDRSLESIGFVNMATGMILQYPITSTIREQLSRMWQFLQQKYNLYQES
jgi:AAA domain/UvrD-like helicase C-terminal domain